MKGDMWVFWGWGKICGLCVCTYLRLLKRQKYTSEKVGQISLFHTTNSTSNFG